MVYFADAALAAHGSGARASAALTIKQILLLLLELIYPILLVLLVVAPGDHWLHFRGPVPRPAHLRVAMTALRAVLGVWYRGSVPTRTASAMT
jgi:hypothetical protein